MLHFVKEGHELPHNASVIVGTGDRHSYILFCCVELFQVLSGAWSKAKGCFILKRREASFAISPIARPFRAHKIHEIRSCKAWVLAILFRRAKYGNATFLFNAQAALCFTHLLNKIGRPEKWYQHIDALSRYHVENAPNFATTSGIIIRFAPSKNCALRYRMSQSPRNILLLSWDNTTMVVFFLCCASKHHDVCIMLCGAQKQ